MSTNCKKMGKAVKKMKNQDIATRVLKAVVDKKLDMSQMFKYAYVDRFWGWACSKRLGTGESVDAISSNPECRPRLVRSEYNHGKKFGIMFFYSLFSFHHYAPGLNKDLGPAM